MLVTSRFKLVGGRLCLDFVNTASARDGVPQADKLIHFEDLAEWSRAAGLRAPVFTRAVFTRAISLREALYRLFQSVARGEKPRTADLGILQSELSIARKHERIKYGKNAFAWAWDSPAAPDRILWPIALSAAELLVSEDRKKIRQCGDAECGWLFLDTSRNHSRQWCDMKDCGNRAKLRSFRERQRLR